MARRAPEIYSIAAHRGFADALVAGLAPRFADETFGLAKTTLILPSSRAMRIISEAFIRLYGAKGQNGLLMPRMAVVGDLDLDESLGPLIDNLGDGLDIPKAVDPQYRWLRLAELIRKHKGKDAPGDRLGDAALLRMAFSMGQVMDRLLAEEVRPEQLVEQEVLDLLPEVAGHWQKSLRLFIGVQDDWLAELQQRGEVDAATRRNLLFRKTARRLKENPPDSPVIAAGVTSAAPALAQLLRAIADLPKGALVLPDLDLSMEAEVWDELGQAGAAGEDGLFGKHDAVTHPQYHLKLLLNRMGVARGEVEHWHRAGMSKGPPARSHAMSSLFLPPQASKVWSTLDFEKRRMSGISMVECAHPEEEAQAIALLARQALEQPEKRIAIMTPDRGLAGRVVQHLKRWNIQADDTAGQPLSQTPAGRVLLLLADLAAQEAAPVPLMALLSHPLVRRGDEREEWLKSVRLLEGKLRGPRREPGLNAPRTIAIAAGMADWWGEVEAILQPLLGLQEEPIPLAELLNLLVSAGEALCGEEIWLREDGRALSVFAEEMRLHARETGLAVESSHLPAILRDAMDRVAVRPPYGGHPRIAIYGLLEGRMSRADLVICGGLNEGTWPATPSTDALLAPAILRALGVPGADFRIGLSAHDLAGAMGAPEAVLTRAKRDAGGPVIASRFWLRVQALLGGEVKRYMDEDTVKLARQVDLAQNIAPHPRPNPKPSATQRRENLSVTALDRLRSDPYQFYAQKILSLRELEALDAEPTAAWQGTLAHKILERWHRGEGSLDELADLHLAELDTHPLMRALWKPRLMKALEWIKNEVESDPQRRPVKWEEDGKLPYRGVTITGKADRIDQFADGALAIVDYKTGPPPSVKEIAAGYAMQLGTLGVMAADGAFNGVSGQPTHFEYWSLGKSDKSETGFGYIKTPIKLTSRSGGVELEDFLPDARNFLDDALDRWILGEEGFTARLNPDARVYADYDQLMRLDEWIGREDGGA